MRSAAHYIFLFLLCYTVLFSPGSSLSNDDGAIVSYGPHVNDSNNPSVDPGHRMLLHMAADPRYANLGQALGFNWTGNEILCNCSGSFCGGRDVQRILRANKLPNVCVALSCWRKKAYAVSHGQYKKVEHSGCFGGDVSEHADHDNMKKVFCANTSLVNTLCCGTSFCNGEFGEFEWPDETDLSKLPREPTQFNGTTITVAVVFAMVVFVLFIGFVIVVYPDKVLESRKRFLRLIGREEEHPPSLLDDAGQPMLEMNTVTTGASSANGSALFGRKPEDLAQLIGDLDTSNSGSGSGAPLLAQRTIARQIELVNEIGQGRFGEVWLGRWKGQHVAVKIFSSRDERSWYREVETFQTHMLRHPNILQFIASDNKDTGVAMQLWLITEYHPSGSLFDYLAKEPIDQVILIQFVRSMANGLSFLHSNIPGNPGKPAIAHRDMKSKNVLVKKDLTCVVADLGLAVRLEEGRINLPDNKKCGTVRYLSPEILDEAIEASLFDSYRYADIYAMGLIVWEMARRTQCPQGPVALPDDCLPYYADVSRDPSLEEMREVVVGQGKRPLLSAHWRENEVLCDISRVMRECWATQPSSRLTATNVRIAMDRLARKMGVEIST